MVCHGRRRGEANASAEFVSADYVEAARRMVSALVWAECMGPNQWALARQRVSERYGIPAGLIRDLEYRPPKTLPAHTYAKIEAAFAHASKRTFAEIWGAADDTGESGEVSGSLARGGEGGGDSPPTQLQHIDAKRATPPLMPAKKAS